MTIVDVVDSLGVVARRVASMAFEMCHNFSPAVPSAGKRHHLQERAQRNLPESHPARSVEQAPTAWLQAPSSAVSDVSLLDQAIV